MHAGCPWWACALWLGCVGAIGGTEVTPIEEVLVPMPPLSVPVSVEVAPSVSFALKLGRNEQFADYLTDGEGRALYMLVDDGVDRDESACSDACARSWPPFDVPVDAALDPALAASVERFHRQDGPWQVRYRGHPLYLRASELGDGTRAVTGDGQEGRWFVARDYDVFMRRGATDIADSFLTDGDGRTLYRCLDDVGAESHSICVGECLANRPPWSATNALAPLRLPSSLQGDQLATFMRPDGIVQRTYRGWPIYYFRGDAVIGATAGHNQGAWRAIDPSALGNDAQ